MKKYLIPLLILIFIIPNVGCKSNAKLNTDKTLVITKGKCLRTCPVYSLKLSANGEVLYEGTENVAKSGVHNFTLEEQQLNEVQAALEKIDFTNLKEAYNMHIRDMPATTMAYGEQTISYKGFRSVPEELTALANLMEEILSKNNFIN